MGDWHYTTVTVSGPDEQAARKALYEEFKLRFMWPGATDEDVAAVREKWGPQDPPEALWCQEKNRADGTVESVQKISRLFPCTSFRLDIKAPYGYHISMLSMMPGVGFYEGWDFDNDYFADLEIRDGRITQNPGAPIPGHIQPWERKPGIRRFMQVKNEVCMFCYRNDSVRSIADDFDYLETVGAIRKTGQFMETGSLQPIYEPTNAEMPDEVQQAVNEMTSELLKARPKTA
jgi:hypothetical protein